MRRMRVALLAGCLLVAGGAGAGTASGAEPGDSPSIRSAQRPTTSDPDFPGPDPRVVEPERRAPGAIPEVTPRGPRAVPMPQLRHGPRSRPVPMPELDQDNGELVIPRRGSLVPLEGGSLRGDFRAPGE